MHWVSRAESRPAESPSARRYARGEARADHWLWCRNSRSCIGQNRSCRAAHTATSAAVAAFLCTLDSGRLMETKRTLPAWTSSRPGSGPGVCDAFPAVIVVRARGSLSEQLMSTGPPDRRRRACVSHYLAGGDMQFTPRRFFSFILGAFLALPALVAPYGSTGLAAQGPVTITGKVTSDAGQPMGQVEVAIPTMGLGALSKDDGGYTLVVPSARVSGQTVTMVARRLGYKSQSAQVTLAAGGVTHDFVLAAKPLQLGEVVVTGAGTTSETGKLCNVRNNVSSDLIQKAGEVNMVQALAAKAPNVTVLQQSGDPGASSFINIRGINSLLGANQPLFVVDGVPIDNSTFSTSNFNAPDDGGGTLAQFGQTEGTVSSNRASDLNPNDIESVEILKGPSASAIYGSQAE